MNYILDSLVACSREIKHAMLIDYKYRHRDKKATKYVKHHNIPQLTRKEKKTINDYWKNYGIQFHNFSWFSRYYYITGKKDPRFLPDPFLELIAYLYYHFKNCYHVI